MLHYKISKEDYGKLSDDVKAEYKESGDGYQLEVSGVKTQEDIDRLKAAKDQAKREQKEAQDRSKELEKENKELKSKVEVYEKDPDRKLSAEERVQWERDKRSIEDLTSERDQLKTDKEGLIAEHNNDVIRAELSKAADGVIRSEAINDTIDQVLGKFIVTDGKVLTNSDLGDKSGLDAKAYLSTYVKDRSYLAPTNKGGGAGGGKGSGGGPQDGDEETTMTEIVQEAWAQ